MKLRLIALLTLLVFVPALRAADKRFPEAKHGKGELKYIDGVPVLLVQGTPEEIGEQFGILAIKPAKAPLLDKVESYMRKSGWEGSFPFMLRAAGFLLPIFPENNRKEINAAAKASNVERNLLVMTNAMPDLQRMGGCSTLIVDKARSKTKAPLFGRLLDWPPHEDLPEFTLITVFRQPNKHALATITFPVILGAISGINEKGLCLAIDEILESKDGSPKSDLKEGMPMLLLFRKILEECATIEEAEKLLKATKRTGYFCLTVCDPQGGCVFEVTTKNVIARKGVDAVCVCTNHFRTDELCLTNECKRYQILEKAQKSREILGVDEIKNELHKVSQGAHTVHAMVFEPSERTVHLAYGGGKSATEKKLTKIALSGIFEKGFAATK